MNFELTGRERTFHTRAREFMRTEVRRDGGHYVANGRKWWSSGVGDPRCKLAIVMGKTDLEAEICRRQTMVLIDLDQ